MKINTLFDNCDFTISDYLNAHNISDTQEFFKPTGKYIDNPLNYDNIEECVELIKDNLNNYIGILQDIDGDGLFSSVIIYRTLLSLNPKCKIKVFLHKNRVHGLNDKELMSEIIDSGIKLLIVPDASGGDFKQHKELSDNNIQCCCLEHHNVLQYSKHAIVVNNQPSKSVTNKCGSGALVTFKVCQLLNKEYANTMIDLVWFSLISDIMDMSSMENRTFAYFAKQKMQNKLLLKMFETYSKKSELNNTVIGWDIQPKISSAIRSDNEKLKQYLFMALATEKDKYIDYVVDECKKTHTKQTNEVNKYMTMLDSINEDNMIIFEDISSYEFYPYYIGLVASKLSKKYNKPTILYRPFNSKEYGGSVRSNIPIQQTLLDSELFTYASGHSSALGVGFKKANLGKLNEYVSNVDINVSIEVACSCNPKQIPNVNYEYTEEYIDLWGKGLPSPKYHIQPFTIYNTDIRTLGKGNTIKFTKDGVDFISFFTSNDMKERLYMNVDEKVKLEIECIVELGINRYTSPKNNKTYVNNQAIIQDFECRKVDEEILDFDKIWGLTD